MTTYRFLLGDTFEVAVGTPPFPIQTFVLHTQMFKGRTGSLAAKQPDDDTVILIKEDPELFHSYLRYVYLGRVETLSKISGGSNTVNEKLQQAFDKTFEKLIGLYLLAKRIKDTLTMNAIADDIVSFNGAVGLVPMESPITLAYASTKRFDTLRRLLCDMWVLNQDESHQERLRQGQFPYDFLTDLAIEFFNCVPYQFGKEEHDWTVQAICADDMCYYHLHDEENPAKNCWDDVASSGKWIGHMGHDLRVLWADTLVQQIPITMTETWQGVAQ